MFKKVLDQRLDRAYNVIEHVQLGERKVTVDLTVVAYLLYLAVVVPLTIWVGRALRRHGEVFLVDVFAGDDRLAHSVNQLLVIGFYLLNFGFLSNFMASSDEIMTGRELMELLSSKVGGVALVIGLIHLMNVWTLNAFRRRAVQRHQTERAAQAWSAAPSSGWPPPATGPAGA